MITAELAGDQGRDVAVVPGNIDSEYNLGSNKLIREGAIVITGAQDLLDEAGLFTLDNDESVRLLSPQERQIYELLAGHGELSVDQLAFYMNKPVKEVGSLTVVMEMKGIVFSAMGKIFIAKD